MTTPHEMMPEYPRTLHLPHKANAKRDDLIASYDECKVIFTQPTSVECKIDGANSAMSILDGHPLIRNRNHILDKAYSKAKNASKMQFSSIWGWWYERRESFELLADTGPYTVYGDWMYMAHGMIYERLPSLFMTYDIYDYEVHKFLDPKKAREIIADCGFDTSPILAYGPVDSFEQLEELANGLDSFSDQPREGVYLKVSDGEHITHRFKMVREGFEQGKLLDQSKITRNNVVKEKG